ncbi:MAG: hypothetical protein GY706_01770 [Bacteroides sp.]|nr:hypothetical protein [Bacteroides sp.]
MMMKRTTTILTLLLVLLIAVHPVVAFHFCSDRLASVQLSTQDIHSCCSNEESGHNDAKQNHIDSKCCHTSVVELSTDSFVTQHNQEHTDIVKSFSYTFLIVKNIFLETIDRDYLALRHKHLSEHFYETGRVLLTRICVYII